MLVNNRDVQQHTRTGICCLSIKMFKCELCSEYKVIVCCVSLLLELFYTEKAHVRVVKVLQRIFYQPMRDETWIPDSVVRLLFPNIDELVQLHCESCNTEI